MLKAIKLSYLQNENYLFNNINFCLNPGQLLVINGPNGSGKTTLLKALTGLITCEGNVYWQQQPISKARETYHSQLLYIGHRSGITALLTPRENLHYYTQTWQVEPSDINQALTAFGLDSHADIPCYQLSAGQQRRVSLAKLLLTNASLWVLDEPLTALDQQGIQLIEALLTKHLHHQGMVILTSHQPLSLNNIVAQEICLHHE